MSAIKRTLKFLKAVKSFSKTVMKLLLLCLNDEHPLLLSGIHNFVFAFRPTIVAFVAPLVVDVHVCHALVPAIRC